MAEGSFAQNHRCNQQSPDAQINGQGRLLTDDYEETRDVPRATPLTRRPWAASLVLAGGLLAAAAVPANADMTGHGGIVRAVAVSPDGDRILTASFDYTARLWDFVDQVAVSELDEHAGPVNAVAFVPGGKRALTAGDDRIILLWDLGTGTPVRRLEGHTHKIVALAVSPDGRRAASAGWDRTVRLWDLERGAETLAIRHTTPVNAVAFTADGKLVLSGGQDGALRLWDAADGTAKGEFGRHDMGITRLAVSADGRRVLTASIDETLRLWDVRAGEERLELVGHQGPVLAAAIAPDGETAISAGADGFIIHWDLVSGWPIHAFRAHEGRVWSLDFSPDGRFVVSAGADAVARVWHLATGDRIGISEPVANEPQPWLTSVHPGARLYRKCAGCHTLVADGPKRSGPHFEGLFGRRAGTVPGFRYSDALVGATFSWTRETLAELFRKGPDVFLPGTKMPLQRIPDPERLTELLDYMEQITHPNAANGGNGADTGNQ